MNKVKHISSPASQLANFVNKVNNDIDELNKLIDKYNDDHSVDILKAIFHQKRLIENKYSDNYISACPDFLKELEEKLFPALKAEFAKYGINDLYGIVDSSAPPVANVFSKILANMEPRKVNKLMGILSQGAAYRRDELITLYAPGVNAEYDAFIRDNQISFLGGTNSKNFKITPNDGSPSYVVKIEHRMGMPKLPAVHLKEGSLKETIIPVMAERMGTIVAGIGTLSRTILTIEYSANGDLNAHSIARSTYPKTHAVSALNVYSQMVNILIAIEEAGCAFPDMKNSNWLIDKNGRVVLADTKAFIFCDQQGRISYLDTLDFTGGSFVQSEFFNPPEFYSHLAAGHLISADKMHAFILGKNIYQYLTMCNDFDLSGINNVSSLNFDTPVFKTDEGKQLSGLIARLLRVKPEDRISLAEAKVELENIRLAQQKSKEVHHSGQDVDSLKSIDLMKQANKELLEKIQQHGFGEKDFKMKDFISMKEYFLDSNDDPTILSDMEKELQHILNQQVVADKVNEIIQDLRREVSSLSGNKARADRIEQAMCAIPVENRVNVNDMSYPLARQVLLEISSSRHLKALRTIKVNDSEIDVKTAAKSSKKFKDSLDALKTDDPELHDSKMKSP